MSKVKLYWTLWWLSLATMLYGENALPRNDYTIERLYWDNPWLGSENAAGLATYDALDFTQLIIAGAHTAGEFRDLYDPVAQWRGSVSANSFKRIDRFVLQGDFGIDYQLNQAQQWSSLVDASSTPLLIGDGRAGDQRRELYSVKGSMGVKLTERWSLGAKLMFDAISNAKMKDIRNRNVWSRLEGSPAALYRRGDWLFGAAYGFRNQLEEIEWTLYGDNQTHTLWYFEGLWFGTPVAYVSGNIKSRRYHTQEHRASLQQQYTARRSLFFQEFVFDSERLNVELKQENERGGESDKWGVRYAASLHHLSGLFSHRFGVRANFASLKSFANLQQRELVNHQYTYVQYGRLLRFSSVESKAEVDYAFFSNRRDGSRRWGVDAALRYHRFDKRFRVYPQIFKQRLYGVNLQTGGQLNWLFGSGMLDLRAELGLAFADGTMLDALYEGVVSPDYNQQEELLRAQFHYMSAEQLQAASVLRYTWFRFRDKGLTLYLQGRLEGCVAVLEERTLSDRYRLGVELGICF